MAGPGWRESGWERGRARQGSDSRERLRSSRYSYAPGARGAEEDVPASASADVRAGNLDSLPPRGNRAPARRGAAPIQHPTELGEYVLLERVRARRSGPSTGRGTASPQWFDPVRWAGTPSGR